MLTLLHISDLHFGPPYRPEVGEALIDAADALAPEVVVASGDFTQRAKRAQFAEARRFLDRLPCVPLVAVPGNHDIPLYRIAERLRRPYALYREYIADRLNYVLRIDGATIVALNSTSPRRTITNGRISRRQLAFCAEAFRASPPGATRIVVAHHHFAPAPDYEGGQVMPHAKRAIDTFTRLRVDLILGGHMHRGYIGNSLDVYAGADPGHGIIIVQSGTTTSHRGRAREGEKNSFNVLRVDQDTVRITHHMYFDAAGGFAAVSRHVFPRAHRPFFGKPVADAAPPSTARETAVGEG